MSLVEDLVVNYFWEGHTYLVILYLLTVVHKIKISLSTIKRILKRNNLKRRGVSTRKLEAAIIAIKVSCMGIIIILYLY